MNLGNLFRPFGSKPETMPEFARVVNFCRIFAFAAKQPTAYVFITGKPQSKFMLCGFPV